MKEKPILFSGPMVRQILAGIKTQTRRPIKAPATSTDVIAELERGMCHRERLEECEHCTRRLRAIEAVRRMGAAVEAFRAASDAHRKAVEASDLLRIEIDALDALAGGAS